VAAGFTLANLLDCHLPIDFVYLMGLTFLTQLARLVCRPVLMMMMMMMKMMIVMMNSY
jgi:hypothetical protein